MYEFFRLKFISAPLLKFISNTKMLLYFNVIELNFGTNKKLSYESIFGLTVFFSFNSQNSSGCYVAHWISSTVLTIARNLNNSPLTFLCHKNVVSHIKILGQIGRIFLSHEIENQESYKSMGAIGTHAKGVIVIQTKCRKVRG